jgi:hypothetical protein
MSKSKKPTATTNTKTGKKTKAPTARRGKQPTASAPYTSEDATVVAAPAGAKPAARAVTQISGLDAAAQVLRSAREPLNAKELVKRILAEGIWRSDGKTPASTIYAAMIREIKNKGSNARFKKVGPGDFTAAM